MEGNERALERLLNIKRLSLSLSEDSESSGARTLENLFLESLLLVVFFLLDTFIRGEDEKSLRSYKRYKPERKAHCTGCHRQEWPCRNMKVSR